jgi:GMP synthase (glutamine-hydrolysing)
MSTSQFLQTTARSRPARPPDRPVLVLQHADYERPGEYGRILAERGLRAVTVRPQEAGLPDWRDAAGLLVLGGPMSVNDEPSLPWLTGEKRFVREAVAAGVPFFGTCLGAQLLASSFGAAVRPASPEAGLGRIDLTPAALVDPLFAGLPATVPAVHWHGEEADLPDQAVLLAVSEHCRQAFRLGDRAYGLQCHLEVTPELARQWADHPEAAESLDRLRGPNTARRLAAAVEGRAAELTAMARHVFGRWADRVVLPATQRCRVRDSNPHGTMPARLTAGASANSATPA